MLFNYKIKIPLICIVKFWIYILLSLYSFGWEKKRQGGGGRGEGTITEGESVYNFCLFICLFPFALLLSILLVDGN